MNQEQIGNPGIGRKGNKDRKRLNGIKRDDELN